jgi:hypothetical protein
MSPLIPACFFAAPATLPLPHSHEMRAPAWTASPFCFGRRWSAPRARSPEGRRRGGRFEIGLDALPHLLVETRVAGVAAGADKRVLYIADPAIEDVAERARGRDAVPVRHYLAVDVVEG